MPKHPAALLEIETIHSSFAWCSMLCCAKAKQSLIFFPAAYLYSIDGNGNIDSLLSIFCSLPISGFWSIHGPIFPWLNVSLQIKSRQNLWDSLTVLTLSDTPLRMDLWNKSSLRENGVFRQRLVWTGILSFVWPWVCKCRQMNTLQCVEFCRNRRLREFPPKKSNVQNEGGSRARWTMLKKTAELVLSGIPYHEFAKVGKRIQ